MSDPTREEIEALADRFDKSAGDFAARDTRVSSPINGRGWHEHNIIATALRAYAAGLGAEPAIPPASAPAEPVAASGDGELERRLWAIIDDGNPPSIPSDIINAVARLKSAARQAAVKALELAALTRPIVYIEDRSAVEVYDIMVNRIRSAIAEQPAPVEAVAAVPAGCDWPAGRPFSFYDDPGAHDPCYVVMPDGAMMALNHHARPGVDVTRAEWIVAACNARLAAASASPDLNKAAQELVEARCSTYRARNGREIGVEDSSGEKVWLVPFDVMAALEAALVSAPPPAGQIGEER